MDSIQRRLSDAVLILSSLGFKEVRFQMSEVEEISNALKLAELRSIASTVAVGNAQQTSAELAKAKVELNEALGKVERLNHKLECLSADLDVYKKVSASNHDANRYRWLRNKWCHGDEDIGIGCVMHVTNEVEFDKEIDAAMAKEAGGKA